MGNQEICDNTPHFVRGEIQNESSIINFKGALELAKQIIAKVLPRKVSGNKYFMQEHEEMLEVFSNFLENLNDFDENRGSDTVPGPFK